MKQYLKPLSVVEAPDSSVGTRSIGLQGTSANQWVQLIAPPEPMAYEQALLLCRQSDDEWLAWIPDYGEITLHVSEFYGAQDWN